MASPVGSSLAFGGTVEGTGAAERAAEGCAAWAGAAAPGLSGGAARGFNSPHLGRGSSSGMLPPARLVETACSSAAGLVRGSALEYCQVSGTWENVSRFN